MTANAVAPAQAAAPPADPQVPALARGPVFAIAGAVAVLLFALSGRFGYYGDELYFLATGRWYLEWGYADNPWLLPLIARGMDFLFPDSVMAIRLPATLMTAAGVVLTALIARELGGARRAQALAAGAYAVSIHLLLTGHMFNTSTTDPFFWTLLTWLVVRWVRTRSDRLLLAAGLTTALAMQSKWLIPLFWLTVGVAALAVGPRDLLRRPVLWLGALVTVAASIPTLLWQHAHDWPYLQMQQVVADQVERFMGGRLLFIPLVVLLAGIPVGAFLLCHGLWQLLRDKQFAQYRFLGWAVLLLTAIFLATTGRYYYVAGMWALLFAVSAVRIEQRRPALWWRWVPTLPTYLLAAVIAIPIALPVFPKSWVTTEQFVSSSSMGWPEMTGTTMDAYRDLPAELRERTVVGAHQYWYAAALEVHGRGRGMPTVYGVERGYWYLNRPPEGTESMLYVGGSRAWLAERFSDVRRVGTTHFDAHPRNVAQNVPVWLCQGPREPWAKLWPGMYRG